MISKLQKLIEFILVACVDMLLICADYDCHGLCVTLSKPRSLAYKIEVLARQVTVRM